MNKGSGKKRKSSGSSFSRLSVPIGIAVILLLIVVILLIRASDRKKAEAESESESVRLSEEASLAEQASIEASVEASIAESLAADPALTLTECTDPQITELCRKYFDLRLSADLPGLYELYGKKDVPPDEDLISKMTAQQSWVRSYDDVTVYALPGEDEKDTIGIVSYKVNFRRVNTKAPGIMYFYARSAEDGSLHLCENLPKETREFIDKSFEAAGVQRLVDENTAALTSALENDSDLALMYESFMNGEIYSDYNLNPDREQSVDLFVNPEDSVLISE